MAMLVEEFHVDQLAFSQLQILMALALKIVHKPTLFEVIGKPPLLEN